MGPILVGGLLQKWVMTSSAFTDHPRSFRRQTLRRATAIAFHRLLLVIYSNFSYVKSSPITHQLYALFHTVYVSVVVYSANNFSSSTFLCIKSGIWLIAATFLASSSPCLVSSSRAFAFSASRSLSVMPTVSHSMSKSSSTSVDSSSSRFFSSSRCFLSASLSIFSSPTCFPFSSYTGLKYSISVWSPFSS